MDSSRRQSWQQDIKISLCVFLVLAEAAGDQAGQNDARTGQAAYEAVVLATRRALAGQFAGLVTAPLIKAALHEAGQLYPGHTELLAELCGVDDFAMMLYLPKPELPHSRAGLGVVHTTLHCALRAVPGQLSPETISAKCRLRRLRVYQPS